MIRTRINTVTELKELYVETLINKTNKVSKVSDGSVLNGHAFGVAKIGQKVQKDIALIESRLFPSVAYGVYLDDIALENGIAARFSAMGSSTYILLVGDAGTTYVAGSQTFTGSHNISFELVEDVTIPSEGYTYALVRSISEGEKTNVDPHTITVVNPTPTGHKSVTNEFKAIGGSDTETDDIFRRRIQSGGNISSTDTLGRLTQIFMKSDNRVMRLFHYGTNDSGQTIIAVLTQNAAPLSGAELNNLVVKSSKFLSLVDAVAYGSVTYSIEVRNIDWYPIDIDLRASIHPSYYPDDVRVSMQILMNKYLDYRYWSPVDRVEWDTLLSIAKSTEGVKYCPDDSFLPRIDLTVPKTMLPRIRKFILRNVDGTIISSATGGYTGVYFPNVPDRSYQSTVLITI